MNTVEYWEVLFQQNKRPCFVADFETHKVMYLNFEMQKLLGESNDAIGNVFYDVIRDDDKEDTTPAMDWDHYDVIRFKVFSQELGAEYAVTLTLNYHKGKKYIVCIYAPIKDAADSREYSFEMAMSQCVTALQEKGEVKNKRLLRILGEYYSAAGAYLYNIDKVNHTFPCVNYWRKDGTVTITNDATNVMPIDELLGWIETRDEMGILEAGRHLPTFKNDTIANDVLNAFHLENLIVYTIENVRKEPVGIVAVSNREDTTIDLRLMQAVSLFMQRDVFVSDTSSVDVDQINDVDVLTGFKSRISYSKKIDELNNEPPTKLGVVFADVNGLKKVNGEYGYAKGDVYVKKASELIKKHFTDTQFYRIAGDEFVAFFEGVDKEEFEEEVKELQEKIKSENADILAIGFAHASGRPNPVELVKEADTIMYINKQEFYHSAQRKFHEITDSTLSDLLSFLENDEFMVYLQPQVLLEDGSLYGAEALIRRFDKTNQKMVFPDQFISLYEKKSIIRHVDIFVIEEVCKLLAKWQTEGREIPISVNLSRVTLQEYGIVDTIAKICDRYEVARKNLVIEVTERVGLVENNIASSLIADFKDRGFKISLDDFGCAYSNIVTLAQIEVDEVKLDKSLVDYLTTNEKNQVLVRNVLRMCNELENTSTLAEGIEDEEQAHLLHELGCHLGQGYLYSRPIPIDEFCAKYAPEGGQ